MPLFWIRYITPNLVISPIVYSQPSFLGFRSDHRDISNRILGSKNYPIRTINTSITLKLHYLHYNYIYNITVHYINNITLHYNNIIAVHYINNITLHYNNNITLHYNNNITVHYINNICPTLH